MENSNQTFEPKTKATIYTTNGFGSISKYECYIHEVGTREYAQYDNAPYVKYTERRKRKPTGFIKTYNPYLLVIAGWDNINPEDDSVTIKQNDDVKISKSRYLSFDSRYKSDFDSIINSKIENNSVKVLFDVRASE